MNHPQGFVERYGKDRQLRNGVSLTLHKGQPGSKLNWRKGQTMADEMGIEGDAGEATLVRWAEIEPEQMNPLLTRQYVTGAQGMVARILLKQGCVVPEHSHPNEQIAMIVSGALEFRVGGRAVVVRAGEVLVIPGGRAALGGGA